MARFAAIPEVPTTMSSRPEMQLIAAVKQNVELLMGLRGETDRRSQAVLRGNINIKELPRMAYSQLDDMTAKGAGYTISGVNVPALEDYGKMLSDYVMLYNNVLRLAQDVNNLRDAVNALTRQLRGD